MLRSYRRPLILAVFILAAGPAIAADTAAPAVEKVVVHAEARFDFDQATMHPDDQAKILAELGKFGGVSWQGVEATGHTDSIGSDEYNQGLSERRAAAVKNFLVSKGVNGDMVATAGKAKAAPIADNSTAAGRAKNRRTDVTFSGIKTASN